MTARFAAAGSGSVIGRPSIAMLPACAARSPAIIINSEDLPQPLGPTSTTKEPGFAVNDTSDTASVVRAPEP